MDAVEDTGGTARPVLQRVVIDSGGTARPVIGMYRVDRYEDPMNPGSYLHDFYKIPSGFPPPDTNVPNVNIGKGPEVTGPSQHDVTWDAASGPPENGYQVRVDWYVNSSLDTSDTVDEDVGIASQTYNAEDDVYAEVYYIDEFGQTGPVTTTSTI